MIVKRYGQIIHNGVMEPMSDGNYVTYSDYQKLVAENAALKNRTVKVPAKVYVKDMKSNVVRWAQVIDALSDAGVAFVRDDGELIAGTRETPVTKSAITEIGVKAIEGFVSKLVYGLRTAGGGDGYHSNPYHECADHIELKGGDYVEALRAGDNP